MGATLLEDIADLVSLLDRTLGGFRARAERVAAAFRDGSFAYLLVSRPQVSRVSDALNFEAELERQGLLGDALVLNCCVEATHAVASEADRLASLAALRQSAGLRDELANQVARAVADHDAMVRAEREASDVLLTGSRTVRRQLIRLPVFPAGVVAARELGELARRLEG
jgi:hypothetical protein